MTWKQSSKRNSSLACDNTPSKVGPGSYNISRDNFKPKRKCNTSFEPRACFPRPDLVTPGPGAYDTASETPKTKGVSSFFRSRSTREVYKTTNNFPSAAEHSHLKEWTKSQQKYAQTHHPKRRKYQAHVPENANYLDEKGRLVRRNAPKRTEADIGPGTYNVATESEVKVAEINTIKRNEDIFNTKKAYVPSADTYNVHDISYKIPIKIKGEYEFRKLAKEINPHLAPMTKSSIPRQMSPIFKNHITREIYTPGPETPGPGAYTLVKEKKPKVENDECGVIFGTRSVRFGKSETCVPGPASYKPIIVEKKEEGPAAVMKNRELTKDPFPTNDVIGPGAYDLQQEKIKPQKSPVFKSRSIRIKSSENDIPGPADYDIDFPVEKAMTISHTRYHVKDDWVNFQMSIAPSPENYYIDRSIHGVKYTIPYSDAIPIEKRSKTPGPGAYDLSHPILKQSYNSAVTNLP